MKNIILGAALLAAMATAPAMANVLTGVTVTGTYTASDNPHSVFRSLADPTTNVAMISDGASDAFEFLSDDNAYMVDFSTNGLLSISKIAIVGESAPAWAIMDFSFAGLSNPLATASLVGSSAVSGAPILSVLSGHKLRVDLSSASFEAVGETGYGGSVLINLTTAAVPEPGQWAMLLAGLGALVAVRRRKTA